MMYSILVVTVASLLIEQVSANWMVNWLNPMTDIVPFG